MQHHQYYTDTLEPLPHNARERAVAIAAEHEAQTVSAHELPMVEVVAQRAYDLYAEEGFPEGQALRHWLQAEVEVRQERNMPRSRQWAPLHSEKRKTPIVMRDLSQEAPHSPRYRIGGFVIAARTVDKCKATMAGAEGDYHFDCPMDNLLFQFKGITGPQFKAVVREAESYEEVGEWLNAHGTKKTPREIKEWSDDLEAASMMGDPKKRGFFEAECAKLGLDPLTATTFDWLEADDRASFKSEEK